MQNVEFQKLLGDLECQCERPKGQAGWVATGATLPKVRTCSLLYCTGYDAGFKSEHTFLIMFLIFHLGLISCRRLARYSPWKKSFQLIQTRGMPEKLATFKILCTGFFWFVGDFVNHILKKILTLFRTGIFRIIRLGFDSLRTGSVGSLWFWAYRIRIRLSDVQIRILLSSSKK